MRLFRRAWGACVLVLVAGLTACSSAPDVTAFAGQEPEAETVAVVTRDIETIVVLEGSVTAAPTYSTSAPAGGLFVSAVTVGQQVEKGQTLGSVGGEEVKAPSAGTVVKVGREARVPAGMPLVSVQYGGFGVLAPVDDASMARLYGRRLGARASLTYGASGFGCTLVDEEQTGDREDPGFTDGVDSAGNVLCLVPVKYRAHPGMRAHVGVDMGKREGVLALPLSAVAGTAQEGTVTVVEGRGTRELQVSLGVSDGNFVEVRDGISEGVEVLLRAPLF